VGEEKQAHFELLSKTFFLDMFALPNPLQTKKKTWDKQIK